MKLSEENIRNINFYINFANDYLVHHCQSVIDN